jgi:hypothetical protein
MPIVPEDLSGTLVTQAHPGCSVVSQSQAEESARRVRKANTRIDELLAAKLNGSEPPSTKATVASSSLVPGPVLWPKDAVPSQVWWSQFVTGDADREVEKETAIKAVRHVARELLGEWKAQGISVDFDDNELVTVRTVVALVEELAGHAGWKMLLRLAGE